MITLLLTLLLFNQVDQVEELAVLDPSQIQAVIDTTEGPFVIEFYPELARKPPGFPRCNGRPSYVRRPRPTVGHAGAESGK